MYHFNHHKVYNSVVFNIFIVLYDCYHHLIPEHFHHPKRNPTPINSIPSPCSPWQPPTYSVSNTFPYYGHFIEM